jgi:molybdopterin/thiamine biosynthesis adenylyltransferase
MAEISLTGGPWELVIPEGMFDKLYAHLFSGDNDEHGAVIAAGIAKGNNENIRLLSRRLHLARDGIDFVPGKRGYRMLTASFVRDRILGCRDDNLVYINIHNHGGDDIVRFSQDDLRSHERGYPALLDIVDGLPIAALVFAPRAVAGDIWLPGGQRRELARTIVVGRRRQVFTSQPRKTRFGVNPQYDRQTRLFGDAGQCILNETKIAIIGLGGVGSLLAEYLGRLGVGHFVLIDADLIEPTNLPRIAGATRFDARTWFTQGLWPRWIRKMAKRMSASKLRIAKRVIRRGNKQARIELYPTDLLEPKTTIALLDCDYIFLAADTMRARLLFNAIVHQYLIPGIQIGAKVTGDALTGAVLNVHSITRPVTPERGCLLCNQLINPSKLQEEGQTLEERGAQRYVDDPDVAAPSVITLNAMGAAQAANDFLFYITGMTHPDAENGYLRFMPLTREVSIDEPRKSPECSECGSQSRSRLARGDLGPRLPTYSRG